MPSHFVLSVLYPKKLRHLFLLSKESRNPFLCTDMGIEWWNNQIRLLCKSFTQNMRNVWVIGLFGMSMSDSSTIFLFFKSSDSKTWISLKIALFEDCFFRWEITTNHFNCINYLSTVVTKLLCIGCCIICFLHSNKLGAGWHGATLLLLYACCSSCSS